MNAAARYYTAAQVRALEQHAIEVQGIPAFELMQRAGKAAFATLREQWPRARRVLVFCGTGNNGGDGCVIAALAHDAGLAVELYLAGTRADIKGTARQALAFVDARALAIQEAPALPDFRAEPGHTVIVDALLGIGLSGAVRPPIARAIAAINASGLPVLAVDLPSGLCSDTGAVRGACIKAAVTVTFIGCKRGLVTGAGPAQAGTVVLDTLGIDTAGV